MINTITNANAYLNGVRLAGKLSELTLPDVKLKTEDVQALGIFGTVEVPVGLEKMEAKFKFNAIYADAWRQEKSTRSSVIIVKSNMQKHSSAGITENVPVTATFTGFFKEIPTGGIKPGSKLESEHTMAVNRYKLVVGAEVIYDIDVYNNVFIHAGEDVLSAFKINQL